LLDEYVLARRDRLQAHIHVTRRRGRDDDRVDIRQRRRNVGEFVLAAAGPPVSRTGETLVNADDVGHVGHRAQHAHVLRPPVTYTDNPDPDSLTLRTHDATLPPVVTVPLLRSVELVDPS